MPALSSWVTRWSVVVWWLKTVVVVGDAEVVAGLEPE